MTYDAGSRGAIGYLEAAHEIAQRGSAEQGTDESRNDHE
jgi:hypothetical protein